MAESSIIQREEQSTGRVNHFAYGSNMDPKQMNDRGAPFTERRRAVLMGWALKFNKRATKGALKGEGKGNVVIDPKGTVEGALYSITKAGLEGLDRHEGYPTHYDRKELEIRMDDGTRTKAWVYIAQPQYVEEGLKPRKEYLARYLKGKDILSPQYFEWLKNTRTID
jgi:cation transport regulator ChaC